MLSLLLKNFSVNVVHMHLTTSVRRGFLKFSKVEEIENAIFQDLESLEKR